MGWVCLNRWIASEWSDMSQTCLKKLRKRSWIPVDPWESNAELFLENLKCHGFYGNLDTFGIFNGNSNISISLIYPWKFPYHRFSY